MTMAQAIALSTGNKAQGYSDNGGTVVVQERYNNVSETWLHVWHIKGSDVWETDLSLPKPVQLKTAYGVDPDADYWRSVS